MGGTEEGPKSLAALLVARLEEKGWTMAEAARRCGMADKKHYNTFRDYITGATKNPPPEALVALSEGFEIPLVELMRVTRYAPFLDGFTPHD